jgi:PKD repeat protein
MNQKLLAAAWMLTLIITIYFMNTAAGSFFIPYENQKITMSDAVEASFFFVPVIPYTNVTVKFDASASKSDNGYIIKYTWDFGDGTPEINEIHPIVYHVYMSPANYTVTLTVTDNLGGIGFASKLITVIPYPSGPWIDLYTQRGGEGLYEPSGNFAPSEKVKFYGLVTYNSEPVAGKLVAFEVHDSTGTAILVRSAETNLLGVAEINFTIPVAGPLEKVIGTWVAFAISSISEQTISDTLTFRVTGIMIDVYSQKPDPYSGKGPHMPSDAFGPQEEVILYAYVTVDLEPIANKLVAFEVLDPLGGIFYRTNNTDENGIATVSFRIPWPGTEDPTELFGIWHVRGWVEVVGMVVEDTLTFKYGWIIEIKELRTVNYTGQTKTNFVRGEHIFFNLTAFNIAFVPKVATFTIVACDAKNVPIGHVILPSWVAPPGTLQIFIIDLQIPEWTFSGSSMAFANAYTGLPEYNGVPYCPETSVPFVIA